MYVIYADYRKLMECGQKTLKEFVCFFYYAETMIITYLRSPEHRGIPKTCQALGENDFRCTYWHPERDKAGN